MNNILLYNVVKSYILYTKFKYLTKCMFNHIESSPIETIIKINKLIKLEKLISDIESIPKYPSALHRIAFDWIEYRWKHIVKNCGYMDISKTLDYLDFKVESDQLVEDNMQSHIHNEFYRNNIIHLIQPIHCRIIEKNN